MLYLWFPLSGDSVFVIIMPRLKGYLFGCLGHAPEYEQRCLLTPVFARYFVFVEVFAIAQERLYPVSDDLLDSPRGWCETISDNE